MFQPPSYTLLSLSLLLFFLSESLKAERLTSRIDFDLFPKWRPHDKSKPDPNAYTKVRYIGCTRRQESVLQQAVADVAHASRFMRDALENPMASSHHANAERMLDVTFGGAFTEAKNATRNIAYLRDAWDAMAQGQSVNGRDRRLRTSSRMVCMTMKDAQEYGKRFKMDHIVRHTTTASPPGAWILVQEAFFKRLRQVDEFFEKDICPGVQLTRRLLNAALVGHEMSHLALVVPWFGNEVYWQKNFQRLPFPIAIYNSQNFAMALLYELSGCTDKLFDIADSEGWTNRKLLRTGDGSKLNETAGTNRL